VIPRAATGSAHHQPRTAFKATPASVVNESHQQAVVWKASASIALLPSDTAALRLARASHIMAASETVVTAMPTSDNGATKWVVWDIPKTVTMLPENVSKVHHPPEVPGATQLGSLGHVGYAGPGVPGPPMHTYEFVIWALDVEALPGTAGLTTAQIRASILPMHQVAISEPLVAKGQLGGP